MKFSSFESTEELYLAFDGLPCLWQYPTIASQTWYQLIHHSHTQISLTNDSVDEVLAAGESALLLPASEVSIGESLLSVWFVFGVTAVAPSDEPGVSVDSLVVDIFIGEATTGEDFPEEGASDEVPASLAPDKFCKAIN